MRQNGEGRDIGNHVDHLERCGVDESHLDFDTRNEKRERAKFTEVVLESGLIPESSCLVDVPHEEAAIPSPIFALSYSPLRATNRGEEVT